MSSRLSAKKLHQLSTEELAAEGLQLVEGEVVYDVGKWHETPPPPAEWLVEGLWMEHAGGFIQGEPGSGKSWLAMEMALSVASGTPFMGEYAVKQGNVYVIIEEGNINDPYSCYQRLIDGKGLDRKDLEGVLFVDHGTGWRFDDGPMVERVARRIRAIAERYGWTNGVPDLVQIDPLAGIHLLDENATKDMTNLCYHGLNPFRKLLNGLSALQIIHHSRKKSQGVGADRTSVMRGAQVLTGWADCIVDLNNKGKDTVEVSNGKMRGMDWKPFFCKREITDEYAKLTWQEPTSKSEDNDQRISRELLEIIEAHPGITTNGLKGHIEGNAAKIGILCEWLQATGQIRREKGERNAWLHYPI
jgi:RecA-family ATPase